MTPAVVTNGHSNGTLNTEYGAKTVEALREVAERPGQITSNGPSDNERHELVLQTFRLLIADLCQQFGGGHPGGAIGMAAIGVALWKYVMKYAPHSPDWFNRDRFVLSNGHTCLFQYTFLHLTGYRDMTFEQLKSYHSDRADALCPGHPEIEHEGIEVTTGPLGQGVANAVGFAMATKNLAATYNRPGYEVVNNHTWCMVGDACLQEGVALEAMSFAGHLGLDNLTIIYDNNQVTCDGTVDLTNTEDVNQKMRACGFEVIDIEDGCFAVEEIVEALKWSKSSASKKPTFINVRTIIGVGSSVAGQAIAHGAALGVDNVAQMKKLYGFNPEEYFVVPETVRDFYKDIPSRGESLVRQWNDLVELYGKEHAELASEFKARREGQLRADWKSLIPTKFPSTPTAARKSSGMAFNPVAKALNTFMVGTADLSPSVSMIWKDKVDFQNPKIRTQCGINGDYSGRYVHYGIREHAMAAIANGMAAYSPQTIIPVTSSFFMFYLYAAPAVRMGALQRLQVIHVATHDSIGTGEDGPTHQPVELAALFRAMPNILYIRPADSEETAGAWAVAIEAKEQPSMLSLSRHNVPQLQNTDRNKVARGAYVVRENSEAQVTLMGVGSELCFAVEMADILERQGIKVRLVSFPSQRLFDGQDREYKRSVLRRESGVPVVVVEAYMAYGWERYADAAFSMHSFGHSLPGKDAYRFFGFAPESMASKLEKWLKDNDGHKFPNYEFADLMKY